MKNLRRAEMLHQYVADQLVGQYKNDDRRSLFAAFLSLVLSHHEAILVLVQNDRLVGSAFALLRPLVEVAYRGQFAAFIATPAEIDKIKNGDYQYPSFNKIATSLDAQFETAELFTQYGGETWKTLCGFTHGGLEQLCRQIETGGTVRSNYKPLDIENLVNSSTAAVVLTAILFLEMNNNSEAAKKISTCYLDLYRTADQAQL